MQDAVRIVQTCYPQIYLACHTRHERAASSRHRLSARDSSLLAHLDERRAITPTALAAHLGVGKPTMSAAVKRLKALGYVAVDPDPRDRRTMMLRLAAKGAAAMRETSVLEPTRVRRLLRAVAPADRDCALRGLQLLADAAQRISQTERRAHGDSHLLSDGSKRR